MPTRSTSTRIGGRPGRAWERARPRLLTLVVLVSALTASAAAARPARGAPIAPCAASQLSAKVKAIAGGGSAGHYAYRLSLKNAGRNPCRLGDHLGLRLLGAGGRALPTRVARTGAARTLTIAPGRTATAILIFLEIPVGSERSPCEPVAHSVRITLTGPAAGSLAGPLRPARSVCGRGSTEERPLI